jgi:hypothetical protein
MRVIKECNKEKEIIIQCPSCDSIIAYTKKDVISFGDEFFGEVHYGTKIKCPVCKNIIILNIDELRKEYPVRININVGEELKTLVGYDLGLKIYQEQVEPNLIEGAKHIIIFPDNIEDISISFTQGFKHSLPGLLFEKTCYVYFKNEEIKNKFMRIF